MVEEEEEPTLSRWASFLTKNGFLFLTDYESGLSKFCTEITLGKRRWKSWPITSFGKIKRKTLWRRLPLVSHGSKQVKNSKHQYCRNDELLEILVSKKIREKSCKLISRDRSRIHVKRKNFAVSGRWIFQIFQLKYQKAVERKKSQSS